MDVVPQYFQVRQDGRVACDLCPHRCVLADGAIGRCGTRQATGGGMGSNILARMAAVHVDPVEKKPLSHFLPGTTTFSLGAAGCNMVCPFCQNAGLSQAPQVAGYHGDRVPLWTGSVNEEARANGCESISFTYSEPILSLEFAVSVAREADSLPIVFVTNGQVNAAPRRDLIATVQAANVDLKGFDKRRYRKVLGGDLQTTLDTIEALHAAGVWVEITTLVVPGLNDSAEELTALAGFIADLSRDVPWHVSRFHPAWKWTGEGGTPPDTMQMAVQIGRDAGLHYVYTGNVRGNDGESTRCPECGDVVIARMGYRLISTHTREGYCGSCGCRIAGVGLP